MKTKKTKYQLIDTDIICPKCFTHTDVNELDSILKKL